MEKALEQVKVRVQEALETQSSVSACLLVVEMEKKMDKSEMRKALEAEMKRVEVPDCPPLVVCGVPFNHQTWTRKMIAAK